MSNKNNIGRFIHSVFIILSLVISTAYAELKLPSGADRRPNLSVDPFERAREALRKLPSSEPEPTPEPTQPASESTAPAQTEREEHNLPPTIVSDSPTGGATSGEAFSYEIGVTVDALSVTAGGIVEPAEDDFEQSKTGIFGLVNLVGEFDTGAAGFWEDGLFFGSAAMIYGKGPAVGDLHGTSGIYAGGNTFRIVELWYDHSFPYSNSSALFGLHDFNSEFYVSEFASLFVNAGFGMGQVIAENGGPSGYPTPTLGTRLKVDLSEKIYFQAAVYDAAPTDEAFDKVIEIKLPKNEELFFATEFGMINKEPGEAGYFKAGMGIWYLRADTSGFEDANGASILTEPRAGNGGVYVLGEMSIGEKLGIFFKHGRGKSEFNQFGQFYAAGLNYTGIIPGRETDVLGFGLVHTRQTDAFLAAFPETFFVAETTYEITYTTEIADWVTVQPDLQFIQQPSMDPNLGNTLVIGVRAMATF